MHTRESRLQQPGNIPQKYPNPLRYYRKLATRKGRLEAGVFLVEGERAVRQVDEAQPGEILEIVTVEGVPSPLPGYPHHHVTEDQFHRISGTKTPQGVLAVIRLPGDATTTKLPTEPGERLLLLEDVQDPGNVGTLIRTAAAFDFSGVILSQKCADPFAPKCVQSTAGSILSVWIRRIGGYLRLVKSLKERGYCLLATDLHGDETVPDFNVDKLILALGNEASGLSEDVLALSDYCLRLPTARTKAESLNVAASGAICMYLSTHRPPS